MSAGGPGVFVCACWKSLAADLSVRCDLRPMQRTGDGCKRQTLEWMASFHNPLLEHVLFFRS